MQPGEISRENAHTRRVWELTLLSGLACLGFGVAWVQDDSVFAAVFAVEGSLRLCRGTVPLGIAALASRAND